MGVIVTQEHDCDAYLSAMDQGERMLDFSQSMVPAYHAIGESAASQSGLSLSLSLSFASTSSIVTEQI